MGDNLFNTFSFNIWRKHKADEKLGDKNNEHRRRQIAKLKRALKEKRLGKTRTVHIKGVNDTKEGLEKALEKAVKEAEKAGDKQAAADGQRFLEKSRGPAEGQSIDVSSDSEAEQTKPVERKDSRNQAPSSSSAHAQAPMGPVTQKDGLPPLSAYASGFVVEETDSEESSDTDTDADDSDSSDDVDYIRWKHNAPPGAL